MRVVNFHPGRVLLDDNEIAIWQHTRADRIAAALKILDRSPALAEGELDQAALAGVAFERESAHIADEHFAGLRIDGEIQKAAAEPQIFSNGFQRIAGLLIENPHLMSAAKIGNVNFPIENFCVDHILEIFQVHVAKRRSIPSELFA